MFNIVVVVDFVFFKYEGGEMEKGENIDEMKRKMRKIKWCAWLRQRVPAQGNIEHARRLCIFGNLALVNHSYTCSKIFAFRRFINFCC